MLLVRRILFSGRIPGTEENSGCPSGTDARNVHRLAIDAIPADRRGWVP
jgi:hypothetical protein